MSWCLCSKLTMIDFTVLRIHKLLLVARGGASVEPNDYGSCKQQCPISSV